jgi:thioredoxin
MAVKKQFTSFEEMLQGSETPLLVDFYAPWCGPCQMMGPILEKVGAELKDQLKVVKINTDKYPDLATKHKITSLPTLIVFKNGKPVDRIEGLVRAEQLIQHLSQVL